MYGVPKFKGGFFWKRKKEVLLSVGAAVVVMAVANFSMGGQTLSLENGLAFSQDASIVGYQVEYNGEKLGVVADQSELDDLVDAAYVQLKNQLGYDPEITIEPTLEPLSEGQLTSDTSTIIDALQEEVYASLDVVKEKGYVMRIGDDVTIALDSEEAVQEVLSNVQDYFLGSSDVEVEVDLDSDEYNTMVMKPKVLMKEDSDVALSTSSLASSDADYTSDQVDESSTDTGLLNTDENQDGDTSDEDDSDQTITGKMIGVDFAEDISVISTYVDPDDVMDVDSATEFLTQEHAKAKTYTVKSGDNAGQIALDNEMKLSDLYALNPGLEGNETKMQIGDELVVMKPEPEIQVETKTEVTYTESVPRDVVYEDDPNTYVGSDTTVQEGSDGSQEVTAIVVEVNGQEVSREVKSTKTITEATDKIISQGTKQFPTKAATGTFIYPVSGYYISSPFGPRHGGFHYGVDLAVPIGTAVHASDGGTVTYAGWDTTSGYGKYVEIDHGNGVITRYAHCSVIEVSVGDKVAQGQEIAKSGSTGNSTGPHVHFEIRFDGVATNPLNYLN